MIICYVLRRSIASWYSREMRAKYENIDIDTDIDI